MKNQDDNQLTLFDLARSEPQRGRFGDKISLEMNEEAFRDSVLIHARTLSEEDLTNPAKQWGVKRNIYSMTGRCYFQDPQRGLVHRNGVSLPVIGKSFTEDYKRIFPEGRQNRRYNDGKS